MKTQKSNISIWLITILSLLASSLSGMDLKPTKAISGHKSSSSRVLTHKRTNNISFSILSLKLRKEHSSQFNYSMIIKYKNTGSQKLNGRYLKAMVYMKSGSKWIYLNGGTTPNAIYNPGVSGVSAIPIKVICKKPKTTISHISPTMAGKRDFMVKYKYKGKMVASKKLLRQKVCSTFARNKSTFKTFSNKHGAIIKKGKYQKIFSVKIKSLKLLKNTTLSNFNHSILVQYDYTGSSILDGKFLKIEIKMYQNNKWKYLNGSNYPKAKIHSKSTVSASIPLKITCTSKEILTSAKKDFKVFIKYKGKIVATKKLSKQSVCKKYSPIKNKPKANTNASNIGASVVKDGFKKQKLFQVTNMMATWNMGNKISVSFKFTDNYNPNTINSSVLIIRGTSQNSILHGSFKINTNSNFFYWISSKDASDICAGANPCPPIKITLKDSIRSMSGEKLDGDKNGYAGGNFNYSTTGLNKKGDFTTYK